jgi:methionine synthase II (cobalamin-independent)
MPPSSVHFNGSVNLADAETVMRQISARIPQGVRRMTDGETGERNYWIQFQWRKFQQMPEFETVSVEHAYQTAADAPPMVRLRLAPGVSAEDVDWPELGYADEYKRSLAVFESLQNQGTIPAGVRLQMQYPTPFACMATSIVAEQLPAVAPAYERALFADLDQALERLPHERIAVQWDVAVEFGALEGVMGPKLALEQITPGLVRCIERVPADVPVGMHLCYGDYGHQHFKEPESLGTQVELLNAVSSAARRPVNFVSFTVPQGRGDSAYFAPLQKLSSGPESELYFALVPYHPDEQPPGTTAAQIAHIDAALAASPAGSRPWGICTECGMGRVAAQDIPRLLDLHREILTAAQV